MKQESAHFSPSERAKGDFEQKAINGLKEQPNPEGGKQQETGDERLCNCIT